VPSVWSDPDGSSRIVGMTTRMTIGRFRFWIELACSQQDVTECLGTREHLRGPRYLDPCLCCRMPDGIAWSRGPTGLGLDAGLRPPPWARRRPDYGRPRVDLLVGPKCPTTDLICRLAKVGRLAPAPHGVRSARRLCMVQQPPSWGPTTLPDTNPRSCGRRQPSRPHPTGPAIGQPPPQGWQPQPPPAWYPDPYGMASTCYWDGMRWTEHTYRQAAAVAGEHDPARLGLYGADAEGVHDRRPGRGARADDP
jgi:hypothetical protein